MKGTFRFFKELTNANNDEALVDIHTFSNPMKSLQNFNDTYESICTNFVYQITATIKISQNTFRLARMLDIDFTDGDSDRQVKLQEMFSQPGLYIDLVVNNEEVISTSPIINMADYWTFPLGNYLANVDGVIPFQENDVLSARIRDRGYGLLGENDFIRIAGSGIQEISTVYRNIVIQQAEVSAIL